MRNIYFGILNDFEASPTSLPPDIFTINFLHPLSPPGITFHDFYSIWSLRG